MGLLRRVSGDTRELLRAGHLIGRGLHNDLVLARREVSADHAVVRWTGSGWDIRDLGSRNGTFVNAERLLPGVPRDLPPGAVVNFGGAGEVWRLEDAGPPVTCAALVGGGIVRLAQDELLALPDDEAPRALIYPGVDGRWVCEHAESVERLEDRQVIQVDGRPWQVFIAAPIELTVEPSHVKADIANVKLRFFVSRDEEHVSLSVVTNGIELPLGSRSFHYLLLTLARLRLADGACADLPPASHGWVYQDELLKKLGIDGNKFGVDSFRARRQLLDAGVEGAAGIIERRPVSRQLRLGVSDIEIVVE